MFLSFRKYVNYYEIGKTVSKKRCTTLTLIIYLAPKMAILTVFPVEFIRKAMEFERQSVGEIPF